MKKLNIVILTFLSLAFIFLPGCAHVPEGEKTYTSQNIWYSGRGRNIGYVINYQRGRMLPAGTEVAEIRLFPDADRKNKRDINYRKFPYILFKSVNPRGWITVQYQRKHHHDRTMYEYNDLMFTNKSFAEQTAGMSQKEINAIRQGQIVKGMSKKAVIMSVGVPSDHKTPDLESNRWYFWLSRTRTKEICFDADAKAISCSGVPLNPPAQPMLPREDLL